MNSLFDAATLHPSGSLRSSMSASLPFCLIDDMSDFTLQLRCRFHRFRSVHLIRFGPSCRKGFRYRCLLRASFSSQLCGHYYDLG